MILVVILYRCLRRTVASHTITFRRRDNLLEVGEGLYFLLILGHPVRQLSACTLLPHSIGALPLAKMCPRRNVHPFDAYFCLTCKGLFAGF